MTLEAAKLGEVKTIAARAKQAPVRMHAESW